MKLLEKHIENQILDYLALQDIFSWKVKSVGTFDQKEGRFRKPSKRYKKGVSDILGIFEGKPLAIEVKALKGRLSPHQRSFLEEFEKRGGIAFVARSVEDVVKRLGDVFEKPSSDNPQPRVSGGFLTEL